MRVSIFKYLFLSVFFICAYALLPMPLQAQETEIPITTSSDEALDLFVEGRNHMENIKFDDARDLFKQALNKDPNFALAHLYLALSANTAADFHKHLGHAVENKSNVSQAEQTMIEAVEESANNRPDKSIAKWEELVQQYPEDKRAHQYLGFAYMTNKHNQKAIEQFNKAVNLDDNYAPAYNSLGYAYKATGDFNNAEEAFQKYIQLLPTEANPHDSIADLYTKMGRHEDAINHYNMAIEKNPNFDFSQQKIGTNLVFLGKHEEGRQAYRKAHKMATSAAARVSHMRIIAHSYLYEDKYDKALNALDEALQMSKQEKLPELTASIYSEKSDIYLSQGNLEKAQKYADKSEKIIRESNLPDQVKNTYIKKALFDKTLVKAMDQNFDEASQLADQYQEHVMKDSNPLDIETYHALLGYIEFEKGEFDNAINEFKQADNENPHILYHIAVAYSQTGNNEEAAKYFDKIANWNEHSLEYALVRPKAQKANHNMMMNQE